MDENNEALETPVLENQETIEDTESNNEILEDGVSQDTSSPSFTELETLVSIDEKLGNLEKTNMGIFVGISLIIGLLMALIFSNYLKN